MNRIQPQMGSSAYKTYQILQPLASHFRDATCQEVGCEAYANGWISMIDVGTALGAKQANYIRLNSGRHFLAAEVGTMVSFTFAPGQRCFNEHKLPVGRPEIFVERDGDFRGNPRNTAPRRHQRPADWQDSFANHQDRLNTAHERG